MQTPTPGRHTSAPPPATGMPCDVPRCPAGLESVAGLSEFVSFFGPQQTRLQGREMAALRRWVGSWPRAQGIPIVLVGCCADTSRSDRAARLTGLVDQLVECGVGRGRICYTSDWVEPGWSAGERRLPPDVVWLKAIAASASACRDAAAFDAAPTGPPPARHGAGPS